jgi:3-hydroxyacyl-CoA dehydrogenase
MAEQLRVAMIGAGLMGSQIGVEYALGGHSVTFLVRDLDAGRARVEGALSLAEDSGIASRDSVAAAAELLSYAQDIDALDPETELAVESVPEDIAVKSEVLGAAAERMPGAIIASNTSSIRLTDLGAAIGAPERTLGTHYWNPPLLMPPVEIVAGDETSRRSIERVGALIEGLGKEPIYVKRDVPGFVWNRLQMALLREVLWLVENDVAEPETVDQVVRSGLARRLRYTGPFETIALGGVHSWTRVCENLFPVISNATASGALERWLYPTSSGLASAKERRDHGLARELVQERTESAT